MIHLRAENNRKHAQTHRRKHIGQHVNGDGGAVFDDLHLVFPFELYMSDAAHAAPRGGEGAEGDAERDVQYRVGQRRFCGQAQTHGGENRERDRQVHIEQHLTLINGLHFDGKTFYYPVVFDLKRR